MMIILMNLELDSEIIEIYLGYKVVIEMLIILKIMRIKIIN